MAGAAGIQPAPPLKVDLFSKQARRSNIRLTPVKWRTDREFNFFFSVKEDMKLFSHQEFEDAAGQDLLKCQCDFCGISFKRKKRAFQWAARKHHTKEFCSSSCSFKIIKNGVGPQQVNCLNCGKQFPKKASQILKSPNHFCSQSCFGIFTSSNKKHGCRRSKLEIWLEHQICQKWPHLEIHFNRRDAINSELDIYIPSLKLAFELNGIFHYEPIFGAEKLARIQNNDERKFAACLERGIELCILDTSQQKYFKEKTAKRYLDIIVGILKKKMDA